MLTRDEILASIAAPTVKPVEIPEWGGTRYVRVMPGVDRDAFDQQVVDARQAGHRDSRNIRARVAVFCLCDASGGRVFEDGDVDQVGALPAPILDRIWDVAAPLNKLTAADVDALVGNSGAAPADDSGSN